MTHVGRWGLVLLLVSLGAARPLHGQTTSLSTGEVGRSLVDHKRVVEMSAAGKVKQDVEKDTPAYRLASGSSPALLFKLPEYKGPYELVITSLCKCVGFSKKIFVPAGAFLDQSLTQTGSIAETDFTALPAGKRPYRLEVTITIDDARKADAFLLLFTNGDSGGESAGRVNATTGGLAVRMISISVKRAPVGTLELETRPKS